jgi:hypothetical protein
MPIIYDQDNDDDDIVNEHEIERWTTSSWRWGLINLILLIGIIVYLFGCTEFSFEEARSLPSSTQGMLGKITGKRLLQFRGLSCLDRLQIRVHAFFNQ